MLLGNIAVFRVVFRRLLLLSRIRSCLTLEASKQVCTSPLQPSFDYADVVWGEISEGCCKELHCLQNRAARIILRNNTSNDTFCVLNWLNLASRRKMHTCILVFKCNLVPKYLTQYFTRHADLHNHATRRSNACTHQSLNLMWAQELLSMQGLFTSILYPIMLKVPHL